MTLVMRKDWLMKGIALALLALVGWAWIDGGREPMHEIASPIPVPGAAR